MQPFEWKRAKRPQVLFCDREAPKSRRRRKRKGEKEIAKRGKVGDEEKSNGCTLSFYSGYFGDSFLAEKTLFDGRGLFGGNFFKNPARYVIPYLFLL